LGIVAYQIAVLCVPLAISFYLALNFAQVNKNLVQQLRENNALIEKNLKVEQDRQHLLEQQNELLEKQVNERTAALKQSLNELQLAQNQLIQKEKLASLGELTAGIAHEIQNPLNFVNNFAELSVELIEECPQPPEGANEDWLPQDSPPGGWGAFWDDLRLNLQKINQHGKRASSIVKNMLLHSRASTGERTMTDLNQMTDECLRLSYHGMRAKDKQFNAQFETSFAENLPLVNIVSEDINRVLLNLFNNAFYAVRQQSIQLNNPAYLPKVTASTSLITAENGKQYVAVCIKDNGAGISPNSLEKIFQPFFTTKPTGEGTGLGLSLSYDIVTKGHHGLLEVESTPAAAQRTGETMFWVKLPI
jgi:signal transduction histidine kinase